MEKKLTKVNHYTVTAHGDKRYEIRSTKEQFLSIIKAKLAQDGLVYDDVTGVIINNEH